MESPACSAPVVLGTGESCNEHALPGTALDTYIQKFEPRWTSLSTAVISASSPLFKNKNYMFEMRI